jgi:hypothetical protein
MRLQILTVAFTAAVVCLVSNGTRNSASAPPGLPANTLCAPNERIIFSCPIRKSAKLVSLCASKDLTSNRGYLQYRFGAPGKIELEYPKDRTGTQAKFQYSHYFRARVDLTEITFSIEGIEYKISDDYNGEEKPAVTFRGLDVTIPGKAKPASFECRAKPKTDYSDLQAVLSNDQE